MRIIRFAAVLFVLGGSVSFGQVRTWVSADGLDSNPCTREFPCRNFTRGIEMVAPGGEVVAMDSGGFGPAAVTKSATLLAPPGVHAAIAPTSGNAIGIHAGMSGQVILRNLYLNSQGATNGITVETVEALHVENCVINGFEFYGILFDPTNDDGRLYVADTVIRHCEGAGIYVLGDGANPRATIDSVRLFRNLNGVLAGLAEVTIRRTVATHGAVGFSASLSKMMIEDSAASSNVYGIDTSGETLVTLMRCELTGNNSAIRVQHADSTVAVSDSTLSGNSTALFITNNGEVISRGDNTVQGNAVNTPFTGNFVAQ